MIPEYGLYCSPLCACMHRFALMQKSIQIRVTSGRHRIQSGLCHWQLLNSLYCLWGRNFGSKYCYDNFVPTELACERCFLQLLWNLQSRQVFNECMDIGVRINSWWCRSVCCCQRCLLWRDRAKSRRNVTSPSQRRVASLWQIATLLLQWGKLFTVIYFLHPPSVGYIGC
jgi:hypothetical protein